MRDAGAIGGFLVGAVASIAIMGGPKGDLISEAIMLGSAVLGALAGDRVEQGVKK